MKRNLMTQFIQWKKSKVKSPILLLGTRQVGKTFLIKEFGETSFKNFVYLNFENSPNYNMLFEKDLNTVRIIEEIELELEQTIHPENTLIILDEIQQAPKAITALKYFKEDLPQYHIVCAGSLLGIMLLREQVSFPVGKVDFKYLYPFTFDEFLIGLGHDLYVEKIKSCFDKNEQMPEVLHSKLIGLYKHYLCIGGMPASINNYRHHNNSLTQFDCNIHENIINAYIADMGKYTTGSDTLIAQAIYLSLPSQLAKENKKFKYSIVKKGSKSAHYDAAIEWLLSSRMNLICNCINYPDFPLSAYTEHSILKLYMNDVGLLNSMGKIPYKVILDYDHHIFRDAITENYVATELQANKLSLYYYRKNATEVDFILQIDEQLIPVKVKSNQKTRSRSLMAYMEKYHPLYSIRISTKNFGYQNDIKSIPLYSVFCLK